MELATKNRVHEWSCTSFLFDVFSEADSSFCCSGSSELNDASDEDENSDTIWKKEEISYPFSSHSAEISFCSENDSIILEESPSFSPESMSWTLHARSDNSNGPKTPELTLLNIFVANSTSDTSNSISKLNLSRESLTPKNMQGYNDEPAFDCEAHGSPSLTSFSVREAEDTDSFSGNEPDRKSANVFYEEEDEEGGSSSSLIGTDRYTAIRDIINGTEDQTRFHNSELRIQCRNKAFPYNDCIDGFDTFQNRLERRNLFPSLNVIGGEDSFTEVSFMADYPSQENALSPCHDKEENTFKPFNNVVNRKVNSSPVSVIRNVTFCDDVKGSSPVSVMQRKAFETDKNVAEGPGRFLGSREVLTEVFSEVSGFELVHKQTFTL